MSEREAGTTPTSTRDAQSTSVDGLLDRAVAAMNRGDLASAHELAGAVLATDTANRDAAALLAESAPGAELRRASLLYADLVGSTELSERHEPELYRGVLRRYTTLCREVIEARYGGHVSHVAGDGLLAVFGLPTAHENDAERAVRAALDISNELAEVSAQVERAVGERLAARAAVHKGLVYLDIDGDEVYGLAANVTSRLHGLAAPGTVLISEEVREIVGELFETVAEPAQRVKGVTEPLRPFRVLAPRPEVPTRGRRWVGPLVGRSEERAVLRAAWAEVRRGAGAGARGVHLVGEPGIGKSRLCASFFDEVGSEVRAHIELLGSPFHSGASFHAIRTLIEDRIDVGPGGAGDDIGRVGRLEDEVEQLGLEPSELVPLLAPIAGIAPGPRYGAAATEGHKLRGAIADAAFHYLLACLGHGPSVLVVEDLHWCDESTVDVVGRVLGADRPDVLVVTTSRDAAPTPLRSAQAIALAPLDADVSMRLVRALDPAMAPDSCSDLVARGGGIPLFLEELVQGAGRAGADAVGRRASPTAAAGAPSVGDVPGALYEPLVSRLHATPTAVPVAAAAATIGRDVDPWLLASVADLPAPELEQALTDLLDGSVLVPAPVRGRYCFRHELLREVAYGLQPPSHRRRLHARVADALAGRAREDDGVDWHLVACHYDLADRPNDAAGAYQQAADGAQRLGALGEARSLLERAIELTTALPESRERRRREVGLRLRRGFLAVSAEGNSSVEAVRDYERCLEIALAEPASDEMFSTLISLWGYYVIRGDLARAERVSEMLRSALPAGRGLYAPENDASFGVVRWYGGEFAAAGELLEAAVAGLTARGDARHYASTWFMPTDAWASAHAFLALARFVRGDETGADDQVAAGFARCRELAFPHGPYTAASVHAYRTWIQVERGDLEGAQGTVDEVRGLSDRHGFDIWALVSALQGATVDGLTDLRSTADAPRLAARAQALDGLIATWRMLDLAVFVPFYLGVSARLRAGGGDIDAAVARVDEALAFAATTGMHFYDAELLRLSAGWAGGAATGERGRDGRLRAALELARAQGATLFERRIADDMRLRPS